MYLIQKVWAYPHTCGTTTTNKLVNLSVVPFCLFILFMGIYWQEYWNVLLFPPPVDHVLSELFTDSSVLGDPAWHASLSYASPFAGRGL